MFQAFHRLLGRAHDEFVVIDTAPTGHTLLLLDVTGVYHRQAMEGVAKQSGRVITPLMRLQDPAYSKVVIVALAETTPIAEASDLQDDLRRAGIEPYGWVVNATLAIPARRTRYSHLAPRSNVPNSRASPHSLYVNGRCLGTPTSGPASERDRSDSLPATSSHGGRHAGIIAFVLVLAHLGRSWFQATSAITSMPTFAPAPVS